MKPLKNVFANKWKKKQISYCFDALKLQLGNCQVDITKDEAEEIHFHKISGMGILSIKFPVSLFLSKENTRIEHKEIVMREMTWQEHLAYEREVGHVVIDPPQVQAKPGDGYLGSRHS